jgi:hypothetical protein
VKWVNPGRFFGSQTAVANTRTTAGRSNSSDLGLTRKKNDFQLGATGPNMHQALALARMWL